MGVLLLLLFLPLTPSPEGRGIRRRPGKRGKRCEGKGGKVLGHLNRPFPEVKDPEASGMGGAGKQMPGGVGSAVAGGAGRVTGHANLRSVGV